MTSQKPKRTRSEMLAYQTAYREKNREKAREYAKSYREKNREKVKQSMLAWLAANAEHKKQKDRARYASNKEKLTAYQKDYRKKNADVLKQKNKERYERRMKEGKINRKEYSAKWYVLNKDRLASIRQRWVEENRPRLRLAYAKRRGARIRQTPAWANTEKMLTIYIEAEMLSQLGFSVHVDHIIPLRGKLVSGLHVENNLQIIDGIANRRKGASFDPMSFDNAKVYPLIDVTTLRFPQ